MAQNSGGWLYEPTGTPVDKATADNAQARVLEIKADASAAKSDAALALSTANSYAGQIAQANTTAGSALATAQGAEATVERLDTDVTLLKERDQLAPGQVVDQETALVLNDPNSESNAVLNAQSVQAVGGKLIYTDDPTLRPSENGEIVLTYAGAQQVYRDFSDAYGGLSLFTQRWRTTPAFTVQDEAGATGGKVVTTTGVGRRILTFNEPPTWDMQVAGRFKMSNPGPLDIGGGLIVRADGPDALATGYALVPYGSNMALMRWNRGVYTNLGVAFPFALVAGTYVRAKLEAVGSTIRGKAWRDGDTEPTGWSTSIVDTAISGPGYAGIIASSNPDTQTWDFVGLGLHGADAPMVAV